MPEAYLTIDDGPSEKFEALVDFLSERKIPAVFFNRGDAMEARPEAVIYGIKAGYIMANHAYSHRRASKLPFEKICAEITKTEDILDDLYERAGVERGPKYFRFPYMDRGMGPALVEPEGLSSEHVQAHHDLLQLGLGHEPAHVELCEIYKKREVQKFLRRQGFSPVPCEGVTIPWYAETEMAETVDSLCTFSTSDWALSERHRGKHCFSTLDDLKRRIDEDAGLGDKISRHIILVHDQAEIHDTTIALVDYFIQNGFTFIGF